MKIVTIVGARPQFIKAARVSALLRERYQEILVHTGQHYDYEMSDLLFDELRIPKPSYELGIGSGTHGWQTGNMLVRCEEVLLAEEPDWVLVYGDTNSTIAGALAAVKLQVPVAHVEAGMRSMNRSMPEEHNRRLADHCSDLLLCATESAVDSLAGEGLTTGVHFVGDVMLDVALEHAAFARRRSTKRREFGLAQGAYALVTIHRPYNTDDPSRLKGLLDAMAALGMHVVFPIHPRTRSAITRFDLHLPVNVTGTDPLGYLDMLALEQDACVILTDSGGVQKEAYFFGIPCVTLRPETEWGETVASGWNRLAWGDVETVVDAMRRPWPSSPRPSFFGDGHAAERIIELLGQ
jgi:UDP-GlcNAc3NAcA epimerase